MTLHKPLPHNVLYLRLADQYFHLLLLYFGPNDMFIFYGNLKSAEGKQLHNTYQESTVTWGFSEIHCKTQT